MAFTLRAGRGDDAQALGRICYDAFAAIAEAHNFPPDFPNTEHTSRVMAMLLGHPRFHSVVAELDGKIVGSNFLDERNPVCGVGPITVDPLTQNSGIGTELMGEVIARARARRFAGIRLVQAGYHCRSLSLYTKLGFDVREHLSCLNGRAVRESPSGCAVRAATASDAEVCNALCDRVHGFARSGELSDAIAQNEVRVVERGGRITGYTTQIAFFGHSVAETNDDLAALIGAAEAFQGPGFLVPSRNGALMRWCLSRGLRVTQCMTLMTMGLYSEPAGAWLPSILY